MSFVYDEGPLNAATKALFSPVLGTTSLLVFKHAPTLTVKRVRTMQEAASCGGLLIVDTVSRRWSMLAGNVLARALAHGETGLLRVHKARYAGYIRDSHSKNVPIYAGATTYGRRAHAVLTAIPTDSYMAWITSPTVLVMGVLTKGHGYGLGGDSSAQSRASHFTNWDLKGTRTSFGMNATAPTWASVTQGSVEEEFAQQATQSHSWVLSTEVHLGKARSYFSRNRAAILSAWVADGAPEPEVMELYVRTYDQAVAATFAEDRELYLDIPFMGGTDGSLTDDLAIPVASPLTMGEHFWTGPTGADQSSELSPADRKYETNVFLPNLGASASAPFLGLPKLTSASYGAASATARLRFSDSVVVPLRELVASISPRAGLAYNAVTGEVDCRRVFAEYDTLCVGRSLTTVVTSPSDYPTIAASMRGVSTFNDSMYGGRLSVAVHQLAATWDTLAQDAA